MLADHAGAANFLGTAVAVGDDPVARQQLGRNLALVLDGHRVGEGETVLLRGGLFRKVAGVDPDVDLVLGIAHTACLIPDECLTRLTIAWQLGQPVGQADECGQVELFGTEGRIDLCGLDVLDAQERLEGVAQGLAALVEGLADHPLEQFRIACRMGRLGEGVRRTMAESTLGGGLNAPGPTLNRCSTRQ